MQGLSEKVVAIVEEKEFEYSRYGEVTHGMGIDDRASLDATLL